MNKRFEKYLNFQQSSNYVKCVKKKYQPKIIMSTRNPTRTTVMHRVGLMLYFYVEVRVRVGLTSNTLLLFGFRSGWISFFVSRSVLRWTLPGPVRVDQPVRVDFSKNVQFFLFHVKNLYTIRLPQWTLPKSRHLYLANTFKISNT